LNPDIQNAIRSGEISAGHGRAIISLESEEDQQVLFDLIIKEKLNVRQAEQAAAALKIRNLRLPKKQKQSFPIIIKEPRKQLLIF
jgi:ParB family chromosome partitioning protein